MQTANGQTESVADRIEALLARCDRVRRGSEISRPVYFGAGGEQHAREVARRDAKTVVTALPSAARRRAPPRRRQESRQIQPQARGRRTGDRNLTPPQNTERTQKMEFIDHHDSRLAAKALRENWPMKPEDRQAAIDHLRKLVADPATKHRERERSLKALATVDARESTNLLVADSNAAAAVTSARGRRAVSSPPQVTV